MSERLRELNIVLGVVAFCLLCLRTPKIAAKLASRRLYFSLAAFPILVCFGSVHAVAVHRSPSPVTPWFMAAYISLIVFLTWLPKGLR